MYVVDVSFEDHMFLEKEELTHQKRSIGEEGGSEQSRWSIDP